MLAPPCRRIMASANREACISSYRKPIRRFTPALWCGLPGSSSTPPPIPTFTLSASSTRASRRMFGLTSNTAPARLSFARLPAAGKSHSTATTSSCTAKYGLRRHALVRRTSTGSFAKRQPRLLRLFLLLVLLGARSLHWLGGRPVRSMLMLRRRCALRVRLCSGRRAISRLRLRRRAVRGFRLSLRLNCRLRIGSRRRPVRWLGLGGRRTVGWQWLAGAVLWSRLVHSRPVGRHRGRPRQSSCRWRRRGLGYHSRADDTLRWASYRGTGYGARGNSFLPCDRDALSGYLR